MGVYDSLSNYENDIKKIVVLGWGGMTTKVHLHCQNVCGGARIAAAIDSDQSKLDYAATRFNIGRQFNSVEECLKNCDIDGAVVIISGGNPGGYVAAIAPFLERGIPVLSEKPLGNSLQEAETLLDIAVKNNVVLMVTWNRRYAPIFKKAKEAFGDKPANYVYYEKGSVTHAYDAVRWFCNGKDTKKIIISYPKGNTNSIATIFFDSGSVATVTTGRSGRYQDLMLAHGDDITVELRYPDRLEIAKGATASRGQGEEMMRQCAYPFEDRFRIIWEHQGGFLGAHVDFIEHLHDKSFIPITDVRDEIWTERLIAKLREAEVIKSDEL